MIIVKKLLRCKKSYLSNVIYLLFFVFSVNFFCTNNPYMAYHSGRAGYGSLYQSDHFIINPAYLLITVLVIIFLKLIINRKFLISKIGIVFTAISITICFINGSISNAYITVIYNSVSVIIVSSLAMNISQNYNLQPSKQNDYFELYKIINLLLLIGIIAAILFRERYGKVNMDFSRISRGEITYWLVLGLHIWSTVISLTVFYFRKKIVYLIPIGVAGLFQLAFANRIALIVIIVPSLIYIIFLTNSSKKMILFTILFALSIINYNHIIFFISGGNSIDDSASILNGRDELWEFYYNSFINHPFIGAGLNLSGSSDYTGGAFSEIGVLKLFGEYGVVIGSFQLIILVYALFKAFNILKNIKGTNKCRPADLIMIFFYSSCFIPFILESHSRILNLVDFYAWLSLYYILHRDKKDYQMLEDI